MFYISILSESFHIISRCSVLIITIYDIKWKVWYGWARINQRREEAQIGEGFGISQTADFVFVLTDTPAGEGPPLLKAFWWLTFVWQPFIKTPQPSAKKRHQSNGQSGTIILLLVIPTPDRTGHG